MIHTHRDVHGKHTVVLTLGDDEYHLTPQEAHILSEDIRTLLPVKVEGKRGMMEFSLAETSIRVPMEAVALALHESGYSMGGSVGCP